MKYPCEDFSSQAGQKQWDFDAAVIPAF